jgi:hypothetical protein
LRQSFDEAWQISNDCYPIDPIHAANRKTGASLRASNPDSSIVAPLRVIDGFSPNLVLRPILE